jgi:hypothetical protein
MKHLPPLVLALFVIAAGAFPAAAQQMESHLHMDHVLKAWPQTAGGAGLLPAAQASANDAYRAAWFVRGYAGDRSRVRDSVRGLVAALNQNFGLRRAAAGIADHIGFAAAAADASDNVKLHAVHVAASAANVVRWADEAVALARTVRFSTRPGVAEDAAARIYTLVEQMIGGVDADGDGTISWRDGEGGLAQAEQHMGFMVQGES